MTQLLTTLVQWSAVTITLYIATMTMMGANAQALLGW